MTSLKKIWQKIKIRLLPIHWTRSLNLHDSLTPNLAKKSFQRCLEDWWSMMRLNMGKLKKGGKKRKNPKCRLINRLQDDTLYCIRCLWYIDFFSHLVMKDHPLCNGDLWSSCPCLHRESQSVVVISNCFQFLSSLCRSSIIFCFGAT